MSALEAFQLSDIAKTLVPKFKPYLSDCDRASAFVQSASRLALYTEIGTQEGDAVGEPILDSFNMMIANFEALDIPITHHVFDGGHLDCILDQIERGLRFINGQFNCQ
ncbi:beta/alpha barrel domain-containing protein [Enterovibrio coralii]|uniref:hypothetical protein n=1 Tax=Enterovibrio coralii TaxID=294935 RepID=UPI000A9BDA45|nr:hypothetical protein [Enterovibrio coralii]